MIESENFAIYRTAVLPQFGHRAISHDHRMHVFRLDDGIVRLPVAEMVDAVRPEHQRRVDHKSQILNIRLFDGRVESHRTDKGEEGDVV